MVSGFIAQLTTISSIIIAALTFLSTSYKEETGNSEYSEALQCGTLTMGHLDKQDNSCYIIIFK